MGFFGVMEEENHHVKYDIVKFDLNFWNLPGV
ncbi:MAG: hypothetical protein JWM76_5225, partial [Pseudonocardiales bacterium]|nr:hypothetical protein [Pseudonocardiales bacterium]